MLTCPFIRPGKLGLLLLILAASVGVMVQPRAQAQSVYADTNPYAVGSGTRCPGGRTVTLNVPDSLIIEDLNFDFRAQHSYRTDINLWVISPAGTRVNLLTGNYTTGWDHYNVTFDDEAGVQVDTGSHATNNSLTAAPIPVRSEGNVLSGFDGQNAQGNWTIGFCDVYPFADNGTVQRFALVITPRLAVLSAEKTVVPFDPGGAGTYNLPGEEVIYSIEIANTGNGPTDTDTLLVIDRLPGEIEFWNGDLDSGGPDDHPGTDPVAFLQANGAAMSFVYGRDVAFATGTPPTSFAGCTYTPIAGYDPAVTAVCVNPKGSLGFGSPDPAVTIRFRGRIR